MKLISEILDYVGSIFYPNRCIFCDELMPPSENLCDSCKDSVAWIRGETCPQCGCEKADCRCKKRHGNYYDGISAVFYFEGSVRECIYRFKFKGDKYAYRQLGTLMAERFRERYADIDFSYVAYIPMDNKRKKKRGYNQSELLAKQVSEELDISFGKDLLLKLFSTGIQHDCHELERKGNLLGVFDVNPEYDIDGKNILLIDDIKTSGATLNECGKMLYLYGANKVFCLTVAAVNSKIDEKK